MSQLHPLPSMLPRLVNKVQKPVQMQMEEYTLHFTPEQITIALHAYYGAVPIGPELAAMPPPAELRITALSLHTQERLAISRFDVKWYKIPDPPVFEKP